MVPPFDFKEFDKFNKKQAEVYFQWYLSQIVHRIEVLNKYIKNDGFNIKFDYSVESLIPIWEWYQKKIIVECKTEEELEKEKKKYPKWMESEISKTKISLETWKFGMDIAVYFAEVVIKNSSGKIYWGYFTKPKNRMSVNRPVLLGFKADIEMDPRIVVENCTRKSIRHLQKSILYETYNAWQEFIE